MPSDFAAMPFAPYPRVELRAHLVRMRAANNSPMPDAAIEEIVDLACHAAETARLGLLEVVDRASDHRVSITAIGIATSLLAHDCELIKEALQHAAVANGLHFETGTLKVQAHG